MTKQLIGKCHIVLMNHLSSDMLSTQEATGITRRTFPTNSNSIALKAAFRISFLTVTIKSISWLSDMVALPNRLFQINNCVNIICKGVLEVFKIMEKGIFNFRWNKTIHNWTCIFWSFTNSTCKCTCFLFLEWPRFPKERGLWSLTGLQPKPANLTSIIFKVSIKGTVTAHNHTIYRYVLSQREAKVCTKSPGAGEA